MQNTITTSKQSDTPPVWSVPNVFFAVAAYLKPAHRAVDVAALVAGCNNPPGT